MLTVDGEEASAMRSTAALVVNTGGTYHLGGKCQHKAAIAAKPSRCFTPSVSMALVLQFG